MIPYNSDFHSTNLHFSDYIRMLPSSWIFDHFLQQPNSTRKILSSSAIQDQIERFSQPELLLRHYDSLRSSLQLHCALAYLMGPTGIGALEPTVGLDDPLIRSLLVYAARATTGAVRYFGFSEFAPALKPLLSKRLAEAGIVKGALEPVPPRPRYHLNDVVVVATLASQGVLALGKLGKLTRAALQRIAKLTHETSASQESGDSAKLLVDYGVHAGLLSVNQDRYVLAVEAFEDWLLRPAHERCAEIGDFAVAVSGSWRHDLLAEASREAENSWLSVSIFPEKERKAAIETLRSLRWAGFAEISQANSEMVFGASRPLGASALSRCAPMPHRTGSIVVLPDFTAVLSEELPPDGLYRFGKVGSLHSFDRVYKGAIGREVINDSLARGLSGDTILAWLESWGAPSNVVATVREWIREFYRLYITEGEMVVATDEKVALQVGAYEPLRPLLTRMPVHTLFRIRRGAEAEVKEILARIGYDYRMPDRDRSPGEGMLAETGPGLPRDRWAPIVKEEAPAQEPAVTLRGKKYGAGLKQVDLNETVHIIDYAILTGQKLVIDYAGSSSVKMGVYTVQPKSCIKGAELLLEAIVKNGVKKQFLARKISKIGVAVE